MKKDTGLSINRHLGWSTWQITPDVLMVGDRAKGRKCGFNVTLLFETFFKYKLGEYIFRSLFLYTNQINMFTNLRHYSSVWVFAPNQKILPSCHKTYNENAITHWVYFNILCRQKRNIFHSFIPAPRLVLIVILQSSIWKQDNEHCYYFCFVYPG